MKKILAIVLVCALALGVFAACGSAPVADPTNATTAATTAATTEAPADDAAAE